MSSPKSLIINCGASHVTAAMFSDKGDGLVLEEIVSRELEYDYSVDEEWLDALLQAVQELSNQHKVRGKATLIVPGYLLLTKNIKVPHVDPSRQQQIIAFEAQQNIPYPLDEVEWDHQVIADDGVETEVTLIAIKKDAAERFCSGISEKGITPEAVEAASILDYNAYRYSYAGDEEPTLLINIGARSSNLIFISKEGFFVRNIALGGNSLTQNIADNLGKSFAQAESIKIAFFTGQTSFSSDDSGVQILQKNAETFLKRMSQEITRSIVTFRRQKRGEAPTRILLTGRGSLLPGLPEYLSEQQKMSVDYFDPMKRLEPGTSVDGAVVEEQRYMLTEALGIASRDKLEDPVGIDLLPERIASEMAFARKKPFLVLAAAALAASVVPPALYFASAAEDYQSQISQYQAPAAQLRNKSDEIQQVQQQADKVMARIAQLKDLRASKNNWINFMADLMQRLQASEDVWLTDLKVARETAASMATGGGPATPGAAVPGGTGEGAGLDGQTPEVPSILRRLDLQGVLLIRAYDPDNPEAFSAAEASEKVNRLLESFRESAFISGVENISLDPTDPRLLRFNFTLILDPQQPL